MNRILLIAFALFGSLYAQNITLECEEISRFACSVHNTGSRNQIAIVYPFVYVPDDFGIQICEWDSLTNTVTQVGKYGLGGRANEIIEHDGALIVSTRYDNIIPTDFDAAVLYRLDIEDPLHPEIVTEYPARDDEPVFSELSIVNGFLVACREHAGALDALMLMDPITFDSPYIYPEYYRFLVLDTGHILVREHYAESFELFAVDPDSGLVSLGYLDLGYPVNFLPIEVDLGNGRMAFQYEGTIDFWDYSDPLEWELSSTMNIDVSHYGTAIGDIFYVPFHNATQHRTELHAIDISDYANPTLIGNYTLPHEEAVFENYTLRSHGTYLLQQNRWIGYLLIKTEPDGGIESIARCYEGYWTYNTAAKYENYIILPECDHGLILYDVSDPYNPVRAHQIFPGGDMPVVVNGHYMWVRSSTDTSPAHEKIYDITDILNPELLYSTPYITTNERRIQFNPNEPDKFYCLDVNCSTLNKYDLDGTEPELMWSHPLGCVVGQCCFADGVFYFIDHYSEPTRHLYYLNGAEDDDPGEIVQHDATVDASCNIHPAGKYIHLRTIDPRLSIESEFIRQDESFEALGDVLALPFENFIVIAHQTRLDFYNTLDHPTGFVEPDFSVPQHSTGGAIMWDDDYLYIQSVDNLAIYAYTLLSTQSEDIEKPAISLANHPNPFNPETTISFNLPSQSRVKLEIFNIKGQKVDTLLDQPMDAGCHRIEWSPQGLSSGVYLSRLTTNDGQSFRKMLLLE